MPIDIGAGLTRARHDTNMGRHTAALTWFQENAGTTQGWPGSISYRSDDGASDPLLLANQPKGIYKPKWSQYALSVRQSLEEHYPDHDPADRPDGTVEYRYHQEGKGIEDRDGLFTNRGLMKCREDQVPIGVFRKVKERPNPQYDILGLMYVIEWGDDYFLLRNSSGTPTVEKDAPLASRPALEASSGEDMRDWAHRCVAARRGQAEFRTALIDAYEGRCAITGCEVGAALEAAHIAPYRGPHTNHVTNGLLLRADVHTLFDVGLIAIQPDHMSVCVDPDLQDTEYGDLDGRQLRLPQDASMRPDKDALARRYTNGGAQ